MFYQDPHHLQCPRGADSWCKFNKAKALGKPAATHNSQTISTCLNRTLSEHLIPIYKRMTDENLLDRMVTGGIHNAESLNNLVWVYCPKSVFVGQAKLVSAVETAVTRFNAGAKPNAERLRYLGIAPTEAQLVCMNKADSTRVQKAEHSSQAAADEIRQKPQ